MQMPMLMHMRNTVNMDVIMHVSRVRWCTLDVDVHAAVDANVSADERVFAHLFFVCCLERGSRGGETRMRERWRPRDSTKKSKQRREHCKRRSRGNQGKMPEWTMPWMVWMVLCRHEGAALRT